MDDVHDKVKESGKWPFVVDTVGQVSTFLKYRDTNMINCLEKHDMQPETIRMALIGAMKFGKPFILDMNEADMFQACADKFDEIQKGLIDALLDKSIFKDEKYLSLVKDTDGADYDPGRSPYMVDNFKFVILTTHSRPNENLLKRTYPISII
ncbi:hypothetical protein SNE40_004617 [Patella caerulea]